MLIQRAPKSGWHLTRPRQKRGWHLAWHFLRGCKWKNGWHLGGGRLRVLAALCGLLWAAAAGADGGKPVFAAADGAFRFGNGVVTASWRLAEGRLAELTLTDLRQGVTVPVRVPFAVTFADGRRLAADDFRLAGELAARELPAVAGAARLGDRLPGHAVGGRFTAAGGALALDWELVQRTGADYLREVVTLTATGSDLEITRLELLGVEAPGALVLGSVDGSPAVAGTSWFGCEHPMAKADAWRGRVRLWVERTLPLRAGQSVTYSAAAGGTRPGQLRRDFAAYVERERARPYEPLLHYNSWYDIGYFTPYTEAEALGRIAAFGRELVEKRGVRLDSFLFDDGWDDYGGDWRFSPEFPRGFAPLREAAAKYGAAPGVWLSPWGGYGPPKEKRIVAGAAAGYEVVAGGFALSGPRYWRRFHQVVMVLLSEGGINQFKFDGTGNVGSVYPGSEFDSDFAAAIRLIDEVREARPGVFVNLTTGTWASPFWLRWADSIWRDGYDHNFTGKGSARERWLTYRDRETYENVVVKGPLFPLNSLMLHGIIFARHAVELETDPDGAFAHEVRSYFASGTQLQELYLTPELLDAKGWETLAAAARWAREHAAVLADTHWVGGNPGRLDVYGWAAWSPERAFLTLRNPDDRPRLAEIDLARQLELPPDAGRWFTVRDLWGSGPELPARLDADRAITLRLAPFAVVTLELTPAPAPAEP